MDDAGRAEDRRGCKEADDQLTDRRSERRNHQLDDTTTEPDALEKCRACGGSAHPETVNLAIWSATGLVVVDKVPAYVCDDCAEQTYDDATASALRQLASAGFPRDRIIREIVVPVFSLNPGTNSGAG